MLKILRCNSEIGQEEFPEITDADPEDINLLNSDAVVAEVLQEIKEQTQEKKVTFTQPEPEGDSPKKQKVRTIYYGRDRSKSRTRLKDVETGARVRRQRDRSASCYNEAEVIRNLAKSVDEANNILMRRREDPGPGSRYSERITFSPSPERYRSPRLETRSEERFARRSRDAMRNKEETERRERSRRANTQSSEQANISNQGTQNSSPSSSAPSGASGGAGASQAEAGSRGLAGGIISFASNLISSGKSRREQSDNRARGLLRKSARNFL